MTSGTTIGYFGEYVEGNAPSTPSTGKKRIYFDVSDHKLKSINDAGQTAQLENYAFGTTSGTICEGNDSRLSNARTPTAHIHPISEVTNLQTTLDGKASTSHTHSESDITNLVSDLSGKQPIDSDLTAIAGLTPTNDDIIQRKAGAWTNRTMAQLKTDLVLSKSDVGLSNVDNTSDANKPISTATQTALDGKQNSLGYTAENSANKDANSGYAGLDSSGKLKLAQFPSGSALQYLRRNSGNTALEFATVTASVTGGQTEIDFGTTPVSESSFTITDASVTATSKIICTVSYEAPTGKDQDELEMDDLQLRVAPASGQFTLYAKTADGSYVADKFKINYLVTS